MPYMEEGEADEMERDTDIARPIPNDAVHP
jgi:hypothetical protein